MTSLEKMAQQLDEKKLNFHYFPSILGRNKEKRLASFLSIRGKAIDIFF